MRDLGRRDYTSVYALQKELVAEVIAGRESPAAASMYLLLVEHDPPVITVTRRKGAVDHVLASAERLEAAGVELLDTDRGGDVTYHGPGQLVVYPIVDLNVLGLRLHSYMRFLEQIVIDVLATFGVSGHRDPAATGVWVDAVDDAGAARKICAMGVRVSRWVAMHGLALNVNPDLTHFDLIVPCGLHDRRVTSVVRERGEEAPGMDEVKHELLRVAQARTKERIAARPRDGSLHS